VFFTGVTGGGRIYTAPGDTLQGVTPEGKKFVGKFTKNSGETRWDRYKRCGKRGDTLQGVHTSEINKK